MNSSSQEEIINVAKFLELCAFNLRSSKLDANTWVSPYVDVHSANVCAYVHIVMNV